ncbi:MAG: type II toxin-antitoxin system Phd/YefM family antitoxin [Balneolales bacterium]
MSTARFELDQDIQPLSEFRKHTADFIDRIKRNKRSIVLTQHGKSAAVLVDVSEYQRLIDKVNLMDELREADQQIERGEVYSNEETKRMVFDHIDKWK